MTFDESKISAEKAAETGVQSQPDALTGSAEENKKVFDLLPLLIIEMLNKLIEALRPQTAPDRSPRPSLPM